MYKRIRHHTSALQHALNGLFWVLKTQPNFQLHIIVALVVMILGFIFQVSSGEMAVLALTITFVLVCELVNTVIEYLIDLYSTEWNGKIKVVKDVSAGMVLVAAMGSVVVGVSIFIPYILDLWKNY
jgi:diacylglycerol kinase